MTTRSHSTTGRIAASVGMVLHALLAVPLLVMRLVAPPWTVGLLLAVWAVLAIAMIVALPKRPWVVPAMPALMVVITIGLLIYGDVVLGWTA